MKPQSPDARALHSLRSAVVLASGTATAANLVHSLIAYIVVRTRYGGRRVLDAISWLTFTLPGVVLGLAPLWLLLSAGVLRPMYGRPRS